MLLSGGNTGARWGITERSGRRRPSRGPSPVTPARGDRVLRPPGLIIERRLPRDLDHHGGALTWSLINDDAPGGFRSPGRRDLLWLARGYYWQFG